MTRLGTALVLAAVTIFVTSLLVFATAPPRAGMSVEGPPLAQMPVVNATLPPEPARTIPRWGTGPLTQMYLRPDNIAMWSLLLALCGALVLYAAGVLWTQAAVEGHRLRPRSPRVEVDRRLHRLDNTVDEQLPLLVALVAGAIWPWAAAVSPLAGLAVAVLTMSAALVAATRGQRSGRVRAKNPAVSFLAGWATMAFYLQLADLGADLLPVGPVVWTIAALVMGSIAAAFLQLQLGRAAAYTVAVIWALVGIAGAMIGGAMAVTVTTVICIAALAFMLVRAAT